MNPAPLNERGALGMGNAATYLGCGKDALNSLIKSGELAVVQIGARRYVRRAELDRWLAEHERRAG